MRERPEHTINLTVPHQLRPGDRYIQPHHGRDDHWLVVAVNGQRLTVARWSWWADRAGPALMFWRRP